MLKTMLGAIGLFVAFLSASPVPAQTMFRPIAIVNDSAITGFDLAQRAQLLIALGYKAPSQEALRAKALDDLIADRLKIQEGARLSLSAGAESIAEGIGQFAKRLGQPLDEFQASMAKLGVTEQTLKEMIGAEIVWRQVVRGRFSRRVEPGEAEIDAEIALMQERSSVAYRLAEIGLPANDGGRNAATTQELGEKLYASLSSGGDFDAAVRKYSRAPSAKRGGEVGWVPNDRLPPQLSGELVDLAVGQITRPFPVAGGISILKLLEKRVDEAEAIDPGNQELRTKMRKRLAEERTVRLAEGLLQELRRDALIELR